MTWLQKIIDLVAIAPNRDVLQSQLSAIVRRAGFGNFAYIHLRPGDPVVISDMPKRWQQAWRHVGASDPLVARARSEYRGFYWNIRQLRTDADPETRARLALYDSCSIRAGLAFPISTEFGHTVLFIVSQGNADWRHRNGIDDVLAATAVSLLHARVQFQGVDQQRDASLLTPRQTLCLRWSAEGKSMEAIALLEQMTSSTVAYHINNARKALDAVSLAQATALATKMRLI